MSNGLINPHRTIADYYGRDDYVALWEHKESLEAERDRLRELVAGQDDGGHWYSQATMDAVVRERESLRGLAKRLYEALYEVNRYPRHPEWEWQRADVEEVWGALSAYRNDYPKEEA